MQVLEVFLEESLASSRKAGSDLDRGPEGGDSTAEGQGNLEAGIVWKMASLAAFNDLLPGRLQAHCWTPPLQYLRGTHLMTNKIN